jgi:integrase
MSRRPTPSTAAVARIGRSNNIDYRLTDLTNQLAATFGGWQRSYLRLLVEWTTEERCALGVVLTMGIVEDEDLVGIAASGMVYDTRDGPTLEWMRSDGRRGARLLSRLVALIAGHDWDPRCGGRLRTVLDSALRKLDGLAQSDDPIAAALACSEAWCFQALPQHLFSHVAGDLPMTPLPRSAYARLESRYALSTHFEFELGDEDDATEALEGFFHSGGTDKDDSVLRDILEDTGLRDVATKSDQQLRDDLAATWRGKIDAAERAGPLTSLQLACALHLAGLGEHKPGTIVGYVKDGLPVVHDALAGQELMRMTSDQLSERLAESLAKVSGQKRINAKAYLGHLWRYAGQWIDVEPLIASALPEVDVAEVANNVISPEEGARMDGWLVGPQRDPDLARQTRLVRRLLGALKVRAAEIFFLQIRNVHIYDDKDYVDLEIVRRGRLHGLKSEDGQRMARVCGALAAELVGQVNLRRLEQKGLGAHLLFGTKAQPNRVYRLAAMYRWLNQAAKQGTGDPTSCCHHFRHGAIDGAYAGMTLDEIDAGGLEQLRVDSGHHDLSSTQRSYLHRFGRLLRDAIEEELEDQQKLSDSAAAAWTNVSAANLRQQLARQRQRAEHSNTIGARPELATASAWHWHVVKDAAAKVRFPDAAEGFALCSPLPPKPLAAARHWSVADMIAFLSDLENGDSPQQAGRQRRLPAAVAHVAVETLLAMGRHRLQNARKPLDVELTEASAALAALDIRAKSAYQAKYRAWLYELAKESPPEFSDATWQAWQRATRSHYIKLIAANRPDRWLGFIVEHGMPASKLRICQTYDDPAGLGDVRRMVRVAMTSAKTGAASPRFEPASYNDRRGKCYLLVADEGDVLTEHTGAAFAPGGLKSIMLALRLSALAMLSAKEQLK